MTSFKKAVENLRPKLEEIGSNEAFFEAMAKFGDTKTREENLDRAESYIREFNGIKATVTTIYPNVDCEKVHKALFDIYFDAWLADKHKFEVRVKSIYSEDKEVA